MKTAQSQLRSRFENVVKPRKSQLLASYAEQRREFKRNTKPILSELNELDEADRRDNAVMSRRLVSVRKQVREHTRALGLLPV